MAPKPNACKQKPKGKTNPSKHQEADEYLKRHHSQPCPSLWQPCRTTASCGQKEEGNLKKSPFPPDLLSKPCFLKTLFAILPFPQSLPFDMKSEDPSVSSQNQAMVSDDQNSLKQTTTNDRPLPIPSKVLFSPTN